MMYEVLLFAHVIGATVLLGTGAGIAFFMVMSNRTGDASLIAHVAGIVVVADFLFTATAAILQPVTGYLLARESGWNLTDAWVLASIGLYVFVGLFWLPVVWIQIQLRQMADQASQSGTPLSPRYHRLYRVWFACGFPAFAAVLAIIWLMIAKPGS
jgi:uncharacterized membrane protein